MIKLSSVCSGMRKHDTHGAWEDVMRTWIQEVTFADSLICEFDSLPHGVTFTKKRRKPEKQAFMKSTVFYYHTGLLARTCDGLSHTSLTTVASRYSKRVR